MNRIPQSARYGFVFVLFGAFVLGPLVSKALVAQPNNPPPPLKVLEQNLDANQFIRVHEQGIADVNVTNPVSVSNLPATQDVNVTGGQVTAHPAVAMTGFSQNFNLEPETFLTFTLPTVINASSLNVTKQGAEATIMFFSPIQLSGNDAFPRVFNIHDPDGSVPFVNHAFTQLVPISAIDFQCRNESEDCQIHICIVGNPGT
jgi:hypothetical protein